MLRFTADVSRFPTRFDEEPGGEYQRRMREQFLIEAGKTLRAWTPGDHRVVRLGIEAEFSVVDTNLNPIDQSIRDAACRELAGFVTPELGASQIEIATRPVDVRQESGMALLHELQDCENQLVSFMLRHDAHLLRLGANPFIPVSAIKRTAGKEKYQRCPDFHNAHQRPGMDRYIGTMKPIDVADAAILSITNSVQVNADCHTIEQAIDFLNRSMEVSPAVTVMGANAGFLEHEDSGFADIRYIAWAISHDIRTYDEVCRHLDTRVGLPARYYRNLDDYLSSVLSHPFFMEVDAPGAAFGMGIGTYWRDARLKFLLKDDERVQMVVEFRPLSTQPSAQADVALLLFYFGLVLDGYRYQRPLLPMPYVRANKESAMRLGMSSTFWAFDEAQNIIQVPSPIYLPKMVNRAVQGLVEFGMDHETCVFVADVLHQRLFSSAPVDLLRQKVQNETDNGATMRQALVTGVRNLALIS